MDLIKAKEVKTRLPRYWLGLFGPHFDNNVKGIRLKREKVKKIMQEKLFKKNVSRSLAA